MKSARAVLTEYVTNKFGEVPSWVPPKQAEHHIENCVAIWLPLCEQIQSEAYAEGWRAGLSEAAKVAEEWNEGYDIKANEIAAEILKLAEGGKE